MRTTHLKLSLPVLAVVAVTACGDARANDATQDDLKRDLELASATTMKLATPAVDSTLLTAMETKPQRAPEQSTVVRRGAGSRAVQSETPTVEAEPELDVAAEGESEVTETVAAAPAPEPINEPVAVAPRPQPSVIQTGGAGDYGVGSGGMGTGRGGVVIRGGGVDGDNCELHRRGRGGIYTRGPIITTIPQVTARVPQSPGSGSGGIDRSGPRSGTREASTTTARPSGRPMRGLR
jgi:hypothetical protein